MAALVQSAAMRIWVARGLVFGILAVAAYGFWQGTPQDVVDAVHRGDVDGLKSALRKDPANVHTKVYAQAYTTQTERNRPIGFATLRAVCYSLLTAKI